MGVSMFGTFLVVINFVAAVCVSAFVASSFDFVTGCLVFVGVFVLWNVIVSALILVAGFFMVEED